MGTRVWQDWGLALTVAAGLNIGLFLLMPALINGVGAPPTLPEPIRGVHFIRLPPPEPPKQEEEKPPPEPEAMQQEYQVSHMSLPQPKLSLPFEINPRLPSLPESLGLPPMDTGLKLDLQVDGIVEAGQLDGPLTGLSQMPPDYPQLAKRRNIQGWVKVSFVVNEQGRVEQAKILAAEPVGIFDQSVLRCVSRWTFRPGTVGGTAVKTRVEQTINFRLE